MGRGYVLGDGKGQADLLEETVWELALEGRVGLKVDSRWTRVSMLDRSTCLTVLAVFERVGLEGTEGWVMLGRWAPGWSLCC